MKRDGLFRVDNAAIIVTLATLLLLLAALPLALRLDDSVDRNRPMYHDLSRMTLLQDKSVVETGKVVPLQLSGGESTEVAAVEFVASEGVSIDVSGHDADTTYCITVRNQHDAESARHCS